MRFKVSRIGKRRMMFGKPKKARNAIASILQSTADLIYQKGKDFFKNIESKSLDLVGIRAISLENVVSHFNSGIADFQKKISSGVATYKKAVRNAYYKQRELYDLTALKEESELLEPNNIEDLKEDVIQFKESKITSVSLPDEVYIKKYELSDKPNRFRPIELQRHLNEEIDESAHELSLPFRANFQHLGKTSLPEPMVSELAVPKTFNILNYFKFFSLLSYVVSIFVGIVAEALIWYLTGKNVMQLDNVSSCIIAFAPMVIVFALTLVFYRRIALYVRTTANIPTSLLITICVAVFVVLVFGMLSAFHTGKKADIKHGEQLAGQLIQKQNQLFLDPENEILKKEITEIQGEIKVVNDTTEHSLITILRYVALSLFGISLLLCSVVLKIVLLLGGKVISLRIKSENYAFEVDRIERDYPVWNQNLENAYILRNELVHLVCKKHVCEQLLMQSPEDKEYNL